MRFWLVPLGALLLLWPVALNSYPFLFFDTPGYVAAGTGILSRLGLVEKQSQVHAASSADAPPADPTNPKNTAFSDARSPYYGLFADISRRLGGFYLTVLLQALWIATAIVLAMRHTGPSTAGAQLGVIAMVSLLGGAALAVSTILPDMAGGVLLLGLGVTVGFSDRLGRGECAFWLVSIVAAASFHKAFFLVALGLFILSAFLPGRPLWRGKRSLLMMGAIAFAAVLTFATQPVVERVTGVAAPKVPFLLGRLIEDGTAVDLLRRECPHTHWLTCSILPAAPMRTTDFLWDGTTRNGVHVPGWFRRSVEERARISAEAGEIVKRTVLSFPLEQIQAASWNAADQLVSIGVTRYNQSAAVADANAGSLPDEANRVRASRFYEQHDFLRVASTVMLVVGLTSMLVLLIGAFARLRTRGWDRLTTFGVVVLAGVFLNAVLSGALVVVADRYQGRLTWTLLFAVFAWAAAAARRPASARLTVSVPAETRTPYK